MLTDVSVHRRQLDSQQGVCQLSLEDAVSRDDVHVAFICTENSSHEESIR